jgi:anti-sigma B factor antagonist
MSSEMSFTVDSRSVAGTLRVAVSGELDLLTEPQLVGSLSDALAMTDAAEVVLDLTDVAFIDSSGLRALLLCRDQAQEHGLPLALALRDGPVARLLKIAGVTEWFSYE